MSGQIYRFFASLRLTVVLLALSCVIVFWGTLAQVSLGLYQAQDHYFRSFFIYWQPGDSRFRIPVFPGGYLVGGFLLINLFCAHLKYYQARWKKAGIVMVHLGIVLLLLGQLATDVLSRESQIRFAEGETKNYSVNPSRYELAVVSDVDARTEEVVAFPTSMLEPGGVLQHERLPFSIRIKQYWPNSDPSFRAPMMQNEPPLTTNGIARSFNFRRVAESTTLDSRSVPTAVLSLGDEGALGEWVVSAWASDEQMILGLRRSYQRQLAQMGDSQSAARMALDIAAKLTEPQQVIAAGKTYTVSLRPARHYNPYSLTLLKTTHEVYHGTDIPKDFRSRVRVENAATGESRETDIYMNTPLRYDGQTFYQYQMDSDELAMNRGLSVLQVVRNPGWLTPYFACILVALGMVVQFGIHLVGFFKNRSPA